MADYPEWVLKYKEKGTYVNCVKGKYYLYAAHSERIPGTIKVNRICDGYLGRMTEKDGLIAPKDKVQSVVTVFEYGLSSTILSICENIHKGFRKNFTKNGDFVMVASILSYMYKKFDNTLFRYSNLSIRFPEIDFSEPLTQEQLLGVERGVRMIADKMLQIFGDDLDDIINHFSHFFKVNVNGKLYLSEESSKICELKQKFNIQFEA